MSNTLGYCCFKQRDCFVSSYCELGTNRHCCILELMNCLVWGFYDLCNGSYGDCDFILVGKFYCKPHYCYRLSGLAQRKRPAPAPANSKVPTLVLYDATLFNVCVTFSVFESK